MKLMLVIIAAFAVAQAHAESTCELLSKAVEGGVQELAYQGFVGVFDDSAARESNRLLQKVFISTAIQSNLILMQANKCQLPKLPVNDVDYSSNALECAISTSKAQRTGDKAPQAECNRDKWARGSKK